MKTNNGTILLYRYVGALATILGVFFLYLAVFEIQNSSTQKLAIGFASAFILYAGFNFRDLLFRKKEIRKSPPRKHQEFDEWLASQARVGRTGNLEEMILEYISKFIYVEIPPEGSEKIEQARARIDILSRSKLRDSGNKDFDFYFRTLEAAVHGYDHAKENHGA